MTTCKICWPHQHIGAIPGNILSGQSMMYVPTPVGLFEQLARRVHKAVQQKMEVEAQTMPSSIILRTAHVDDRYKDDLDQVLDCLERGCKPEKILSSKQAFDLLAYAAERHPMIMQGAFELLVNSFRNKRDTLKDYAQAIWMLVYKCPKDIFFLREDQIKAISDIGCPEPLYLENIAYQLNMEQIFLLLQAIGERVSVDDPMGMGPVRFSELSPVFANYCKWGKILRIVMNQSSVLLSLSKSKDFSLFSLYTHLITEGQSLFSRIRNFENGFTFKVKRIEVSKKQLDKRREAIYQGITSYLSKNSAMRFTIVEGDYIERDRNVKYVSENPLMS